MSRTSFNPLGGYKSNPYEPNSLIINHNGGVTSIASKYLERGIYLLELIGSGGGGGGVYGSSGNFQYFGGGGSGAGFVGEILLQQDEYEFFCGNAKPAGGGSGAGAGGDSWLRLKKDTNKFILSTGGTNAVYGYGQPNQGFGGKIQDTSEWIKTKQLFSNGNNGQGATLNFNSKGGIPLYYDCGRGSDAVNINGTNGLIKLTYLRQK